VVVFLDDVLIYSRNMEEHKDHLKQVFQLLKSHNLHLKLSKCSFARDKLEFLGHVISKEGVATDPTKVSIVQNWPIPECVKDVRRFLGMAGYYRKFVRGFGIISKPLTNLLKKGQQFVRTAETQDSFLALKQALTSAPVLALPNFDQPFVIEMDASDRGIGAMLHQRGTSGHPIAASRVISLMKKNVWPYCLQWISGDHTYNMLNFRSGLTIKALSIWMINGLTTPWQHKALTKLMGLQFQIVCTTKGWITKLLMHCLEGLTFSQILIPWKYLLFLKQHLCGWNKWCWAMEKMIKPRSC
jgi:hypothetical protein